MMVTLTTVRTYYPVSAMKTVCAWCGQVMRPGDGPVSHGMCEECRDNFVLHAGVSLQSFIDGFEFPILVVDGALKPISVNQSAAGSSPVAIDGVARSSIGAIVECDNSKLPEGCGHTVHCTGCVLRQTLKETSDTGEAFSMVPAKLTTDNAETSMLISTLKLDGQIFVKLEKLQPGGD